MTAKFNKAWAAFAAAAAVCLASGLITGDVKVWIATAIAAVTAGLNTLRSQANKS